VPSVRGVRTIRTVTAVPNVTNARMIGRWGACDSAFAARARKADAARPFASNLSRHSARDDCADGNDDQAPPHRARRVTAAAIDSRNAATTGRQKAGPNTAVALNIRNAKTD